MSNQPSTPEISKAGRSRRDKLVARTAASVAGLSFFGGVANAKPASPVGANKATPIHRVAEQRPQSKVAGSESRPGLRDVKELPGYGHKVSPEQIEELKDSSVHIIYRPTEGQQDWIDNCTATKISWHGKEYVVSGRHCFSPLVNQSNAAASNAWSAHNYLHAEKYTYAITDGDYPDQPFVFAQRIALSENSDWALLEVAPAQKGPNPAAGVWENIPAINYDKVQRPPIPGEQVVLYGYSAIDKFKPATGLGVYLGRTTWTAEDGTVGYIDQVGINPSSPDQDSCNYGDSGSSFMSASGFHGGTLWYRSNIGYANGQPDPVGDRFEVPDAKGREFIENMLGVDTSQFATVCGFTVRINNPGNHRKDTMASLVRGLNYPVALSAEPFSG